MKTSNKTIYWIFTILLSALMITSVVRYILDLETFKSNFETLGYNGRIVIPLAIAKILGLIAIISNRIKFLKEWAYAGFFFNFLLALESHIALNDGYFLGPIIALTLLIGSYVFYHKVYINKINQRTE
ncbi:DoxX family protein [Winogradskyella sp.]|uniref:DoxX family protein n=1 Tax=Winogradskyella sp. TaxID=1883156 RepID=UPI002627F6ED|nr:DoxX family protein [Winogradskyella sp.]